MLILLPSVELVVDTKFNHLSLNLSSDLERHKIPSMSSTLLHFSIFPVGLGRSTVTISSSIIGIFHLKFFTIENGERVYVQLEEEVEIVIGRDKVSTFLFLNSFFLARHHCHTSASVIVVIPAFRVFLISTIC